MLRAKPLFPSSSIVTGIQGRCGQTFVSNIKQDTGTRNSSLSARFEIVSVYVNLAEGSKFPTLSAERLSFEM